MKIMAYTIIFILYSIFVFMLGMHEQFQIDLVEYQEREMEFDEYAKDIQEKSNILKDLEVKIINEKFYEVEIECIDKLNEVEGMLIDLYIFTKAKDLMITQTLEKYHCIIKEEL
jgi:hypothetical protein